MRRSAILILYQDGKSLKHAYTKDAPNGLPQMTQVMVKGTQVWDDTDQMIFLEEMVKKDIVPKLSGPAEVKDKFDKDVADINKTDEINSEDIPF